MGVENYNVIEIEDTLIKKLATLNLTSNLYCGTRPSVTPTTGRTEYVVVRVSTEIDDRSAYGAIITVIEVYTKDKSNLPDRSRLSSFRNTIATVLPYSTQKYTYSYSTETPTVSDGNGYTFQIIKLFTLIK